MSGWPRPYERPSIYYCLFAQAEILSMQIIQAVCIIADRSAGKMCIPEECSYSAEELEHRACTRCGQSTWAVSGSAKSLVFLPAEIAQTQFHTFSCQSENCCGTLTVDGREHGIFRKTPDLAFAAEVLYQWASGLDCGSPLPWSTSWRRHLVSLTGYDQSTLEAYWKRFKPLFSEATLDFVKLQGIDYGKGFHCNCWQGRRLLHLLTYLSLIKSKTHKPGLELLLPRRH